MAIGGVAAVAQCPAYSKSSMREEGRVLVGEPVIPKVAVALCLFAGVVGWEGVRAGEETSVPGSKLETVQIEGFEGTTTWNSYRWNRATGSFKLVPDAPAELQKELDKAGRPVSKESAELKIQFAADQFQWYVLAPPEPLRVPGKAQKISFWLKGAGTKHYIELQFFDRRGNQQKLPCGNLEGTGWRKVIADIPESWAQPLFIRGIVVHNWEMLDPIDLVVGIDQLDVITDSGYDFGGFSKLDEIKEKLDAGATGRVSFGNKELDRQSLITEAVQEVKPQAVPRATDIYFTDDFMRTETDQATWTALKGSWRIASIYDSARFDPTLSANAFCYYGSGECITAVVMGKDTPAAHEKTASVVLRIKENDGIREGMEFLAISSPTDETTGEVLLENVWLIIKLRVVGVSGHSAVCEVPNEGAVLNNLRLGMTVYLDREKRWQSGTYWLDQAELTQLKHSSVEAIAVTGQPFWCNYAFDVAAKALSDDGFGLYVYYTDQDNHYLVSFPCRPGTKVRLTKRVKGKASVLAEKDAYLQPRSWYHVSVTAQNGRIVVVVDSHVIFDVRDSDLKCGMIGLHAVGIEGAHFDDVFCRSVKVFADPFEDPALKQWEVAAGTWSVGRDGERAYVEPAGKGTSLLLAGEPKWQDYTVSVEMTPPKQGRAEVLFDYVDAKNQFAVECEREKGAVRLGLAKTVDGKRELLTTASLPEGTASGWVSLQVENYESSIRVRVADTTVMEWVDLESEGGRVGLRASEGAGVRFADFAVKFGEQRMPTLAINRVFANAQTMENWAGLMSDWEISYEGKKRIVWNKKDFYGNLSINYRLADVYKKNNTVGLVLYADGRKADSGYAAVFDWTTKPGEPNVSLYRKGKLISSTVVADLWDAELGGIRREGQFLLVSLDERPVLMARDQEPINNTRFGVWSTGEGLDGSQVEAFSDNMHNDVFSRAAVDWRAETGKWTIVNRWSCSPQWSWLGGESDQIAALWHKQSFKGNMTLDFYAAPKMGSAIGEGVLETAADTNISICADGRNPDSGYCFIYGGWRGNYTRILRKGKVVAETRDVLPPSWRTSNPLGQGLENLHRRWFHFTVVKKGAKLQYYVDNELALEYEDPEPIEGGQVCIWTVRNGLMLARARISYTESAGWEYPLIANPKAEELAKSARIAEYLDKPGVFSPTHPANFDNFDHTLGQWQTVDATQAARLSLVAKAPDSTDRALRLENVHAGGRFEARCISKPFDAARQSVLGFDYKVPPDVQVNFYLTAEGRSFCVAFTGEPDESGDTTSIGKIENVVADNEWHHASFNLKQALLKEFPGATSIVVSDMIIGCHDEIRYLMAGFGANRAGATYYIDNFYIGAPGGSNARFTWWERGKEGIKDISYVLDSDPETIPDDVPKDTKKVISFSGLKSGVYYFHLRARKPDETWTDATHYRIDVDGSPPTLRWVSPAADGARHGDSRVVAAITDAEGSEIDAAGIEVKLRRGEAAEEAQVWRVGYGPTSFDPLTGTLTLDLLKLTPPPKEGERFEVQVANVKDRLGNAMDGAAKLSWVFDPKQDREPPRLIVQSNASYFRHSDFEEDLGRWSPRGGESFLSRDSRESKQGKYSLRAFCRQRGAFGVVAVNEPFSAGKYPLLAFDYKFNVGILVDLLLDIQGRTYNAVFTDNDGIATALGTIRDAQADGEWHHCEVNLLELLRSSRAPGDTTIINSVSLGSSGYAGNARGDTYWIDNFELIPVVSTSVEPLWWKWQVRDVSKIAEYRWAFGPSGSKPDWKSGLTDGVSFSKVGQGLKTFLLKARDEAGNWSEQFEQRVLVDDQPPTVGSPTPGDGDKVPACRIVVPLSDRDSAVDENRSSLTVAGREYPLNDPCVRYNLREELLVWDGTRVAPEPVKFQDGQKVAVSLKVFDNAGNCTEKSWSWQMDYKGDRTGPDPPYVTVGYAGALVTNDFEKSLGTVGPYLRRWIQDTADTLVERVSGDAADGQYAARLTSTRTDGRFATTLYAQSFDFLEYPIVSFDYRIKPDVKLDLMVRDTMMAPWKAVAFTGGDSRYETIGKVEGVIADGQWHHAELDLGSMLQKVHPASASDRHVAADLIFANYGTSKTPVGAELWIDNFTISRGVQAGKLTFSWSVPTDATGIEVFACTLDQKPDTEPDSLVGKETTKTFDAVEPGKYFFHIRARDGAGNWGKTRHFPVIVREARDTQAPSKETGRPAEKRPPRPAETEAPSPADPAFDTIKLQDD